MFSFMAMTCPPPVACRIKDIRGRVGVRANLRGALNEGVQLSAGDLTREVLHAAVGADHEALRVDVAERGTDPIGDDLGALDLHVVQVEDAEDHALRGQLLRSDGSSRGWAASIEISSAGHESSSSRNG